MQEATEGRATTRVGNWDRPAHHQCAHLHESGERCNGTTATGKRLCHTHEGYSAADPLYPIQVPLLEDPSSIRFVLSQAVRQLALGAIPPANGRAILYGCRMAFDLLKYEQAERRLQAQMEKKIAVLDRMASEPVSERASQVASESANTTEASEGSVESHPGQTRASTPPRDEPASRGLRARMGHPADLASDQSVESPLCENRAEPSTSSGQVVGHPASQPVREPAGTRGAAESSPAMPRNPAEPPFVPSAVGRDCPQAEACTLP